MASSFSPKQNVNFVRHGVKVGPGPRDPGHPSKFKSGIRDPLRFKRGNPGPPSMFKSGTPETSPFFDDLFFLEYLFFLICFFSSFLNNKHYNIRPYLVS